MLEFLFLVGVAFACIHFGAQKMRDASEKESRKVQAVAAETERQKEMEKYDHQVPKLERIGVAFFIDAIEATPLPADLRSVLISKFRSHHEWDVIKRLNRTAPEHVQSQLKNEADRKVRRLMNQVRDYLPPIPMISVGGTKTWNSYSTDFWRAFEEPKYFSDEHFSWDGWYNKKYDVGGKFTQSLQNIPITIKLPSRSRVGGQMIMAPPDHGKTTCMESMIMDDVRSGAAVVVIDSQQGMIERLLRALPEDRLIYLYAGVLEYPLALSAFNLGRIDRINDEVKVIRALDMFENMFSSMEFSFTTNQSTLFRELCMFLVAIPNATLSTAIDILRNGYLPYSQYLHSVPNETSSFVTTHLGPMTKRDKQGDYGPTRREVERRILALGRIPAINRMFNAPTRKVDFADALRKQKLILINTAQGKISPSGAKFFGKYCLMQLALEILARPETNDPMQRVHFYIDEAQEYFSGADLLSLLLEQGRKRGLCLVMAFHHLGQLNKAAVGLSDTIRALTAIKFVKASNGSDARAIAGDIQADPNELMNVRKHHFFVDVRDVGNAVFAVPNSKEKLTPRRTKNELEALKKRMLRRYSYDPSETKNAARNSEPEQRSSPETSIDPDAPQNLD